MRKLLTGIESRVDKFIESKNVRDVELAKIRRDVQRTIGVLGTSISIGLIICSYDNK